MSNRWLGKQLDAACKIELGATYKRHQYDVTSGRLTAEIVPANKPKPNVDFVMNFGKTPLRPGPGTPGVREQKPMKQGRE